MMPHFEIKQDANGRNLYFIDGSRVNVDVYNQAKKELETNNVKTEKK